MSYVAINQACQMVEETAKDAIGSYVFNWPHLQPATIARKASGDTPLLETGELRDSISHYTTTENGEHVGYDAMLGRTVFAREWREAIHALREAWHAAGDWIETSDIPN